MRNKIKGRVCTYPSFGSSRNQLSNEKQVMTAEEVAAYTGYTKSYIYKLCFERKIPHYNNQCGRRVFFLLEEIVEWCTANKVKTVNQILKTV